nr:hypothetical protein CFP56_01341 [Quercus suber]
MSCQHARSDSSGTDSSTSHPTISPYQLILDHILTYPGSYEIPLRTMYTLNCASRAQHIQRASTSSSTSSNGSPASPQAPWQDRTATQEFAQNLIAQVSQLPNQPTLLPPSFIMSFLRKTFPAELVCVDFPSALTGLDYLKDLETRRRREVASAFGRLGIDRATLTPSVNDAKLSAKYPGVLQWIKAVEEKERKVEALYTQLYVALRRWLLINEMSLMPFNKHNCVAMLNTLYPPVISSPPTSRLTMAVLGTQRDTFFKYITSVEKKGPRVLSTLMDQGKAPMDDSGWPAVTRTLGIYLQLANSMMSECSEIIDGQELAPQKDKSWMASRTRKADSGVSFASADSHRPPTRSSAGTGTEPSSPVEPSRPKTPSGVRSGTALEKLARGLKTMGRSRTDVTEMVHENLTTLPVEKPKGLRKMRSMGTLEFKGGRKGSVASSESPTEPAFDVNEMRRQRMRYDANSAAAQKFGTRQPFEMRRVNRHVRALARLGLRSCVHQHIRITSPDPPLPGGQREGGCKTTTILT